MAVDIEITKWKPFRDALRKPERNMFENMILRSKLYVSAGARAARAVVLEAIFMSILLDQQKRILELVAEVEKLKIPAGSKEPANIEKLLQLPSSAGDMSTWQTTLQTGKALILSAPEWISERKMRNPEIFVTTLRKRAYSWNGFAVSYT